MARASRILICLFVTQSIFWHSNTHAVGQTGAQFLKIGVGAKACGMGEAFVAVADDASSVYWNPAGITSAGSVEIMATHNAWLLDMTGQYVAAVVPYRWASFGGAITYSSSGDIPKYEDFEYLGEYSAWDFAGTVALARRFSSNISIGVGLKLIQQKIEEEEATTFAADIGFLYETAFAKDLRMGLAVQNLGSGVKFIEKRDALPLNVKGGLAYSWGSLTLAGDLNKPRDNDLRLNTGAELVVKEVIALRGGYDTENSYTAGVGVVLGKINVDYAVAPYEDIDESHRISVRLRL